MKKLFLVLPLFLLVSCAQDANKCTTSFASSNDVITETISLSNYYRYLNVERVSGNNPYQKNEKIVFSGALNFATYNVTISYSGVDCETGIDGNYSLELNIGGNGETKMILNTVSIDSVTGTCTYRY